MLLVGLALALPPASHSYEAHGRPAWKGVVTDWQGDRQVHVLDSREYEMHPHYVQRALGRPITLHQFALQVRVPEDRVYLPFFLYDLRERPLFVDGRPQTWALQIQDYHYRDAPIALGEDVAEVAALVAEAFELDPAAGVVILPTRKQSRPNTASAPPIVAAGFVHAPLQELIRGSPPTVVMNPGVAVGRVRDASTHRLEPTDIAVFEALPERVPPVAGMITLAPQTALSHVNLLARNRGTPNVVVQDASTLPMDQWVRMTAGPDGVAFEPATEDEIRTARAQERAALAVPPPDRTVGLVDLAQRPGVEQVGAKAANYGLLQATLPTTRPGFALGFGAYAAHVEAAGAGRLIDELVAEDDPRLVEPRLAAIRHAIRNTPVDPAVLAGLREVVTTLGASRIRLRSSTNCEDLPRFNGAGLYTSKGFDADDADARLAEQLTRVWASLWGSEAHAERAYFGIDHREAAMGVLVHEAFSDELANGVALWTPDGLLVNAQPGEHSVVHPEPGTRAETVRVDGAVELVRASSFGPVFAGPFADLLPELERQIEAITPALIGDLDGSWGVDVEFKIVEGPILVLKQARLLPLR